MQKSQHADHKSSSIVGTLLGGRFQDLARVILVVERLISEIERTGLYTVGIYRKPGPAAKIKQLTKHINSSSGNFSIGMNCSVSFGA